MTDKDYADKQWLRDLHDDSFQLISPDVAFVLLISFAFAGYVFSAWL